MPFSYDINADDANRSRRRSQRAEKQLIDDIESKALGANLGQLARGAVAFDPNAEDGDGDGIVQDGTPYERPSVLSNIAETMRQGLASATGYNAVFTNGHSPTKGMTNREVAEYAVPDNPARFLEMRLQQQSLMRLSNSNPYIQEDLEKISFDPEGIEQLRNLVERTLDERPALRVAWDRFGVPPIGISSGKNQYAGVFLGDSILMDDDNLKVKPIRSAFSNAKIMNLLTSASLGAPSIKGIKRAFVSTEPRDTLTHEWGHYLQSLTERLHPDSSIREAAALLDARMWDNSAFYKDQLARHPKIKRLFDYFASVQTGSNNELPDDSIPFVSSSYATTQPSEFVAEMVSAYFSPDKKTRALLNDAGAQLVEEVFLGIGRGGLASSSVRRSTTGSSMRGLTPAEMAERIVPSTLEETLLLLDEHQKLLALSDDDPVRLEALDGIFKGGVDAIDFSPEIVEEMRQALTGAIANNRLFRDAVERHGMPPVLSTKRGTQWDDDDGTFAITMMDGLPAIIFNQDVRQQYLQGKFSNETIDGAGKLEGTEQFLISNREDAMFVHEWAHYINRLAATSHPDPEIRKLASFWFSETWEIDPEIKGLAKFLWSVGINVKAEDKFSQRVLGAWGFGAKVKTQGKEKWNGYPHVMSQYGQTMPAEAFAEGVTAIFIDDENLRGKVSPALRDDIFDIIGKPDVYERDIARGIKPSRAGLASFSIPRDADGDIIIPNTATSPDADKTPLGGRDWLKGATNEEIADTLSPRSIDDFVSLTLMNMLYGKDPSGISAYAGQLVTTIMNSFFPETKGAPGHFIDFTPQGVDRTRDIIQSALDASPEFAWIVRTFGSVPIVSIDPDVIDKVRLQEMITGTQIASDEARSAGIMGWSLSMLGVVINTASKPGRRRHPIGQRRRLSDYTYNEDLTLEEFLSNTDMSMEGTLYHEWFHSFWSRVTGWHSAVGASGLGLPGERADRQDYLYPGVPNVDRITKLVKDAFDADGFIPYSSLSQSLITPIIAKAKRKIRANKDSESDFIAIMANHDSQLDVDGLLWTPELSRRTLDEIRARYPYLVDDLAPMLNVSYGTATRQEQFAEGGVLFVTPDRRQRSTFLPPELESMYAYILGLKSDPSPGDYDKPWLERSGLASRYVSEQRSINTVGERVHTGKELFIQSGASQVRPDPIKSSTGMIDVSINGYDFSIAGALPEFQEAYGAWNDWQENWRMRYISSEILGLNALPTQSDTRLWQSIANNHLKNGTINEASPSTREDIQRSTMMSLSLMKEIARKEQLSNTPLYRSIGNVGENDAIATLNVGETLSMPLTSFSPDYNSVLGFSKDNDQTSIGDAVRNTGNVIVKLREGTGVAHSPVKKRTANADGREVNMPIESITAGEFIVKSKTNVNGVDVIELEQSRVIDPLPGLSSSSLTGDIVDDYSTVKRTRINREKIDSIPEIREYAKRLDSLKTPKERKDRIMSLIESIAIRDFNEQSVDEAIEDISRDIRRMAQSGLFNQGEGELRPSDAQNYWYIADLTDNVSEVLKRSIYRDIDDKDVSEELANTVDRWQLDFRVDDPSGGPSNMFEEFGLASSGENPFSGTRDSHIRSLDEDIASRKEYISNLEKALDEWNDTGVWKGGDYGVAVNPDVKPSNITREGMLERNYNPDNFSVAAQKRLDELKKEVETAEASRARISKQPDTTTSIESILADPEALARIEKRAKEVSSMSRAERSDLFRDGDYEYVVHWGADTLDGGILDPARSRGDENSTSTVGNTRRINKVTSMQLVAERDYTKQKLQDLTNIQQEFDKTGLIDLSSTDNPSAISSIIGTTITTGKDRNYKANGERAYRPWPDAEDLEAMGITEITPEMRARIAELLERSRNDNEQKLKRLDYIADKLIADDYQYSSTYPAEKLATANGYGGRYGEEGDSWSHDRPRATRTGIHVFRVRIGEDATKDTGGPDEIHIIGQHKPVASLSIETHRNAGPQATSAQNTWPGWLAEVIEADKKSRSGLASVSVPSRRSDSDIPEQAKTKLKAEIETKQQEIDTLEDLNNRLRAAKQELEETGNWEGQKYNIRISDDGLPPTTLTKEELEADLEDGETFEKLIKGMVERIDVAGWERKQKIDKAKQEQNALKEKLDFLETREQNDNSFSIDELLADDELANELRKRDAQVKAMTMLERDARYTDEEGYIYVLHWGASTLQDGVLDPSRSRGQVGAGIQGNTRQINDETAKFMVGKRNDARRDISILEDMKLQAERNGVIDFNEVGRSDPSDPLRAGRARLLFGIDRRDRDVPTAPADAYRINQINSQIGSERRVLDRLDKVADQLIADDYQYSSTYRAAQLQELFSSYGGRYAEEGSPEWGDDKKKSPFTGIHVFRVKVGEDAVEENSVGETHLVGKHTPIASLIADNDPESKNPASDTWAGWVDMVIEQDKKSRSGLASRGTPVSPLGKSNEEIAKEIELTPEEVEILQKVLPDVSQLEEININPSLEDRKQELIDSVRVTVGEDGIPFIFAAPHPLLSEEIPDKREWSAVIRPSEETRKKIKDMIDNLVKKSMGEDTPEEFWTRSTDGGDKYEIAEAFREESTRLKNAFSEWASNLLNTVINEKQGTPAPQPEGLNTEQTGVTPWLGIWAEGLRDLGSPLVRPFDDNNLNSHDAWGHLGTGRGFDRHGEWANMLAMFSLMERWAEENGVSKDELLKLKAGWFQTFEFGRVDGEFKPSRDDIRKEDKWYIKQWAIDSAIDFADTDDLEELFKLLDDGNTHNTGKSMGLASASSAQKAEIVKNDTVRQTVAYDLTDSGLASSGSPADDLRGEIMMHTIQMRQEKESLAGVSSSPSRPIISMRSKPSSSQLEPTDNIEEAKTTGRPLSILRPGTMPPKTQSSYDKILATIEENLKEALELKDEYIDGRPSIRKRLFNYAEDAQERIDEILSGKDSSNGAQLAELRKSIDEEYGSLGFSSDEVRLIINAFGQHLAEQRSYLYWRYSQPESMGDEARLQHTVEMLNKANIAIAFPKELLEKLIADGRFKTQFETNTSRGSLHPSGRITGDIAQFGYHPDTAPEMRPVYGYLTSGGTLDRQKLGSIKQYGELQFVLKTDMHSRSTYTTHDSLSTGLTPSPMGVPSKDASGNINTTMYSEAQIHGGVSLSDIDYVVVNVGEPDQWDWQNNKVSEEEFQSISGMLGRVGIRVVPVRDGEIVDTWNNGSVIPEPKVEPVGQPQEPVKVVA